MEVKRSKGSLAKQAFLAPRSVCIATPNNCFPSYPKMSSTEPKSAQLSLLGNQKEYTRCKLLRQPQLCRELVQLWSSFCLISGRETPTPPPPRCISGSFWLPPSSSFMAPHCSGLWLILGVQTHSFFTPGAVAKWHCHAIVPLDWVYSTLAPPALRFQITLNLFIWLHPDVKKNSLKTPTIHGKIHEIGNNRAKQRKEGYKTINTG